MLKMDDIRKLSTSELVTKSTELRDEINEMKRRIHVGETQNPRVLRVKRRDLARVLTVLSEQLSKENA
jgi:large subunit ribosomal protein L29